MRRCLLYASVLAGSLSLAVCCKTEDRSAEIIETAAARYSGLLERMEKDSVIMFPRTLDEKGNSVDVTAEDWTSGFFPGSLWYLYKFTGDGKWMDYAMKYTEALDSIQYVKWHHDVGFMIGCSFLNAERFGGKDYDSVIVQTARSLSTRFRPAAGILQSWNVDKGWQSERGWQCPVIIDNMMNLEVMFEATARTGDSTYYNIAVSHADRTLENHFRPDHSCYHVVDYDMQTGKVRSRETGQGFSDESSWARGQAWAIYGYTMCYRYTRDERYLKHAQAIYDFIFCNPHLPEDLVPYWDYDAINIPEEPRDASAASITASALYEMSTYLTDPKYRETADKIMDSLASPAYLADDEDNGGFLLMHSTGSFPHHAEIDVPLNYADYYFLEALYRKDAWKATSNI